MKELHYAENGKRDIHQLENEFDKAFNKWDEQTWKYDNNRKIVIDYVKSCRKGKTKSGNKHIRIQKSTLYRTMGILKLLSEEWLQMDFDKVNQEINWKHWNSFYDRMEENKILNAYGKKYQNGTKAKNYKTIRKFLKWKYGENKYYPKYCEDWVTTEENRTKEFLTRGDVEKLVNGASAIRIKCLIMMLFDGGFRIEEAGNIKWSDIRKPDGKEYYQAYVKAETSKVKKDRYVSLPLASDFIDMYKNSLESKELLNSSDYLFSASYGGFYSTVSKLGKRVLNRNISPHTMRHSSATYYSEIIQTYQNFCYRYGWNLNSKTAQRYFHKRSDDEIVGQAKDHEIQRYKTEFERQKLLIDSLRKQNDDIQRQMKEVLLEVAKIRKTKN